jgi:glycosyltransferase involved in cell wall biosynthesis
MRDWPIHVVPNAIDLSVFRPWPKALAREMLGLPADIPLLAFGAMGGTRDLRKGWDLLQDALKIVGCTAMGAQAVIFGQSQPKQAPDLGLPLHWTGHLGDDITLALLYSAVDLVVVPSRQDNLPQTATEPQACGCPVVAFDACGLPDAVEDGVTGLLARPYDSAELAAHIVRLLTDAGLHACQSVAARERAMRLWNSEDIVARYRAIYESAIGGV